LNLIKLLPYPSAIEAQDERVGNQGLPWFVCHKVKEHRHRLTDSGAKV